MNDGIDNLRDLQVCQTAHWVAKFWIRFYNSSRRLRNRNAGLMQISLNPLSPSSKNGTNVKFDLN